MDSQTLLQNISKKFLFPILILGTITIVFILRRLGYSTSDWIEYTYNSVAIALIILEFVIPRNSNWNYIDRTGFKLKETSVELFFFYFSGFFAGAVTYPFSQWVSDHIRSYLNITSSLEFPLIAQALVIVLMIDFIRYWIHRWMHQNSFLWRFHALHHLPERLGVLSSTRTHPVDDFLLYVPEMIFLFTLGFNRPLVAALYSIIWAISLIKHSNIEIDENWFSKQFQIPKFHLKHHEYQDAEEPTYNFSEVLTFWDRVFGTFKATDIRPDHKVGVYTSTARNLIREFFGWIYLPPEKL